jgi:hypothetical protein
LICKKMMLPFVLMLLFHLAIGFAKSYLIC